jgi:thioredoxin 1
MTKDVTELTDDTFDRFIAEGKSVIDFWAPWCGPCRMLTPEIESAAKAMKGKVKFGKVNLDEASLLAMRFEVMSIPTMFFFKDGKLIEKNSGWISRDGIIKLAKESF